MIITQITLENYKQYRGQHTFPVAEDATVGVVGANGVGKTTIFEAIEWCLYKPTSISNKDIRPRGTGGEVRVVVQLTTNRGDEVYEVERVLKRSSTQATVYRINEIGGGEPVVQGTREVTEYISTRLIGLGHGAFVATFFTRQKELGFFDNLRPAERRREVGKLLGFETIKQAQALIAEDRSRARADADSLQRQYDARTDSRDLAAEAEAVKASIASHREALTRAEQALKTAETSTEALEKRQHALQELRDRHNAIESELRDLQTRRQHAIDREAQLMRELKHLDQRETERGSLAAMATREPELRAERARLEAERERFHTRERILGEMQGCGQTIERSIVDLRALVDRTRGATENSDWAWSDNDNNDPLNGIDRLFAIASVVDIAAGEARLASYRDAVAQQQRIEQESVTLQKYLDRQKQVEAKLDRLMREGDPADHRSELERRQETARAAQSSARATIASVTPQRGRAVELADRLEQQQFDDVCPTCGRPFTDGEAELVISTLRQRIAEHDAAINQARGQVSDAEQALRQLAGEQKEVQAREKEIQQCRSSLAAAKEYITQQQATVASARDALQRVLVRAKMSKPPQADAVQNAEQAVRAARTMAETTQPLAMLKRSISDAQEARTRHERDLAELADVQWDAAQYRQVVERHGEASSAASAVQQIDRELARRPQLEHDLGATRQQTADLTAGIEKQTEERESVGFDPAAHRQVTTDLQAARQAEREQREQLNIADRAAREEGYRLETLERETAELATLAEEAATKRQLRDELDLMYSEFSEFDKFVAQHLSPRLSEITSDVVAEMTDGVYDRVEFDEDYGIEVYDGTGEKFALETFSGGERDAIALAARLALSRMVGSQATNPPGFLVLDEVFGSLDAERRERVLTLLGQHSHEYFRQMFIISHVDDVQQSPVFDTVWQVVQDEDGNSDIVTVDGATMAAGVSA